MAEVAGDLRRFLADEPIRARPPSAARRAAKWIRRHRTLTGVSAVILLALAVVSASLAFALRLQERQQVYAARGTLEELREGVPALLRSGHAAQAEFEGWRRRGEWLLSQRPALEERLAASRAQGDGRDPDLLAEIGTIETLLARMDEFFAEKAILGLEQGVFHELIRVRESSLTGAEARRRWREAREDGLAIEPCAGLLPLARNATTGLWELFDLYTGEEPAMDDEGRIVPAAEMGVVFVVVPGGSYWMGAQAEDPDAPGFDPGAHSEEAPVHRVEVPSFLLAKTELTQGQYERGMGSNQSSFSTGDLLPVESLTWEESDAFCTALGLRLPSEAEWEYACRAGTKTPWSTGESLDGDQANFRGGPGKPLPIMSYPANQWGFNDMHGNVWEWCQDVWADYEVAREHHPAAHEPRVGTGAVRVTRGGSAWYPSRGCRSACRNPDDPVIRDRSRGFRVAASASPSFGN